MQAVILAAGQGTRLRPLTYKTPKPMLLAAGRPLLEHNLRRLPAEIDEIVMVVGYLKEQIMDYFGEEYEGRKIIYIEQKELLGTGHAVHICRDIIRDRFLAFMGDDIYDAGDMKKCLAHRQAMLVSEVNGPFVGGRIVLDQEGRLNDIVEGSHPAGRNFLNAGLYVIDKIFFDYELVNLPGRNEYGLPQTLVKAARDLPVNIEIAGDWLQVTDLEGFIKADKALTRQTPLR